jgi:hypothetical protein
MSLLQRIMTRLSGKRLAAAMKAESQEWIMRCKHGHEISVWQAGGIRYGARSAGKTRLAWCPSCKAMRWMAVSRRTASEPSP